MILKACRKNKNKNAKKIIKVKLKMTNKKEILNVQRVGVDII